MSDIVVTGLAANDPVPGVYNEILFGQGPAAGDASERRILLMGNKTSAGSATLDSVVYGPTSTVPLSGEAEAIALFGPGSELHRMYRRAIRRYPDASLWAIAVTESAGNNATLEITIATTATGNGTHRLYVADEYVETGFVTGDTVTNIAAAIVANVNAMTHWPVTAANVSGVITLTAKQKGPRGNLLRGQAMITGGVGTTTTVTSDTPFTGGTTADSNATALATVLPYKFYRIATSAHDATQVGAVLSQVNTQAAPVTGILQNVFAGSVDTIGNATTFATTLNGVRAETLWHRDSPIPPSELAAHLVAVVAKYEDSGDGRNPRCNFAGFGNDANTQADWDIPASRVATSAPTRANIKAALNNGLSPVGVNPNGSTYLVNRVTTRSLSGSVADYRARDPHKRTICDFFADDLKAKVLLQHSGKKIAGTPARGARVPGASVLTEDLYRGTIKQLLAVYDGNDLLQNVEQIIAQMRVERGTNPSTRMGAHIPLQTIDIALQFANVISQVA